MRAASTWARVPGSWPDGVEEGPDPDVAALRARHRVSGRYLAYAGSIDAGKGCTGDAGPLRTLPARSADAT